MWAGMGNKERTGRSGEARGQGDNGGNENEKESGLCYYCNKRPNLSGSLNGTPRYTLGTKNKWGGNYVKLQFRPGWSTSIRI